jgi:hypothetical protein
MKFYSGFSLKDELNLFHSYIKDTQYTISGFSYGAIKAFEETKRVLNSGDRVDTLELFSPAFFQTKDEKFIKLQKRVYLKNKEQYLDKFLDSCFFPHAKMELQRCETTISELEELLDYTWDIDDLNSIIRAGVSIEVYLGEKDQIIDVDGAYKFFKEFSTVTYIKDANHFLQTN